MRGYLTVVFVPILALACGTEPAPPPNTDFDRVVQEAIGAARAEHVRGETLPARMAVGDSASRVPAESVLVAAGYVIKGRTSDGRLIVVPPPERIPRQ